MNLTIEVTEKQAEFLKQFADNHYPGAKDNLGTHNPIHVVQSYVESPCKDCPDFTTCAPECGVQDDEGEYKNVAYFFTLKNAKEYIKYQGHNLYKPRTYSYSPGYDNRGEYDHFYDLLISIGRQLNYTEGTDEKRT